MIHEKIKKALENSIKTKCLLSSGAVDGVFTTWTAWTTCSEPTYCLQGSKTRTRTCTNPAPANGGDDCVGLSQENKDCPTQADGCSGKVNIVVFVAHTIFF